jgi:hypothetical protein
MKRKACKCMTTAAVLAALMTAGAPAVPDSLVPPPSIDPALGDLAAAYDRQFFTFNARPFGLSLDGHIIEAHRSLIAGFFGQSEPFETYASMHPFEVLASYGEHGDLGMFGGVAAVGDALRYVVLRDSGAPAAEVDQAREAVVRAMNAIHIMQAITGEPGVVVRGVMRITPDEAGAPPVPGCCPATMPLFDGGGNPQPVPKAGTWRDDLSTGGLYPDWVWMDDTSKDQVDGYAAALGALWDAVVMDPTVPEEAKQVLVDDARAWAHKLMTPVPIEVDILGTVYVDMVLTDADGRLTNWYGLNPRVIDESTPIVVPEGFGTQNGFNALLGLSVIKVCHHLTGDEDIAAFYYDELIGRRGWLDKVKADLCGVKNMYVGASTNFSNVNMAFTAVYSLLRYEGDAGIRDVYRDIVENHLYRPGLGRQAGGLGQSWFDLIFAGLRGGGTDSAAVSEALATLGQFTAPPYFNPEVINCDAAEISAGTCTAVDGTTVITLASGSGHGGSVVAENVLPKSLRPPSNFEWRSDPHDVNGGGGNRLNPGGDFRAAYWLGRFLQWSGDNSVNVSPYARDRWGGGPTDEVEDVMEDALVETPDGWDDVDVDSLEPGNDFVIPEAAADPAADAGADAQEEAADGGGGGGCGCRLVY